MSLLNNLPIKTVCLVLAIGFWIFSSFQLGRVGTFPAEIEIKTINVPSGLLAILSENNVKIRISAQPQIWQLLSSDSFQAQVDLLGKAEGIHPMPITVASNNSEVQILRVLPDKIQVNLEKVTSSQIQPEIQIEGIPRGDYAVTGYQINPENVVIKTVDSIRRKIAKVVAKVNVEGEENDFSRIYELVAWDNQGNSLALVNFEPQEVNVSVQIGKSGTVKTVGIRPEIIDNPQEGYLAKSISVNPAVLAIQGTAGKIYDTEYISTSPISIKDLSKDLSVEALLVFPSGITSLNNLKKVSILIKIRPAEIEKQITSQNFSYLNLAPRLQVKNINPASIQLKVKGSLAAINNLKEQDIQLEIDLVSHRTAGQFEINLDAKNIRLPDQVELVEINNKNLKVEISD